jgi:hypothetical protein
LRSPAATAANQALIFFDRHDDDNWSPVLFDRDRLGTGSVDEKAEAILRRPCRHALHPNPPTSYYSYNSLNGANGHFRLAMIRDDPPMNAIDWQ